MFAYSFSTLVGGISFFPGGIGAAEASMAALLIFQKVPQELALSGTIIIRLCTLWFAVGLGLVSLMIITRTLAVPEESEFEFGKED